MPRTKSTQSSGSSRRAKKPTSTAHPTVAAAHKSLYNAEHAEVAPNLSGDPKNHEEVPPSQNISWTLYPGSWLVHFIITFFIWTICGQLWGRAFAWQLTVLIYNATTFVFFHWIVGDPFDTAYREFTFWEQMAVQLGHTPSLLFMSFYPVLLFVVSTRMVAQWNTGLFWSAVVSLGFVVVPKLSFMHMKRLFGIRKYN